MLVCTITESCVLLVNGNSRAIKPELQKIKEWSLNSDQDSIREFRTALVKLSSTMWLLLQTQFALPAPFRTAAKRGAEEGAEPPPSLQLHSGVYTSWTNSWNILHLGTALLNGRKTQGLSAVIWRAFMPSTLASDFLRSLWGWLMSFWNKGG